MTTYIEPQAGELSPPEPTDENGGIVGTLNDIKEKGEQVIDHATSGDWGSVLLDALEWFGIDIRGWIEEKLFGDFDSMSKAAGVYTQVGGVFKNQSEQVRQAIVKSKSIWTGDAARTARAQMLGYSAGLDVVAILFEQGGPLLQKAIGWLKKLADKAMALIEEFINFLVDKIIAAMSGWFGWAKTLWKAKGYVEEAIHFFNDAKEVITTVASEIQKVKQFYDDTTAKIEEAKGKIEQWQGYLEHAGSYAEAIA